MAAPITITRERWLGYRWQRHGLAGSATKELLDDLLLLGVQDSRQGGAQQSLSQRTTRIGSTGIGNAVSPTGPLVAMWSVRGAPHAHRPAQLDVVRDALAPQDSDDGGAAYVEAVATLAAALRDVVTAPTTKADASTQVTALVPASLVTPCASCKADHVPDGLFRAAGRQAQLVLGPAEQRATVLHPTPRRRQQRSAHPRQDVLYAYLRTNGPTTRPLFRDWMGIGDATVADLWTELRDPVRVEVDGRRYDLPDELVNRVLKAPKPRGLVLLPPNDAYLRQVDRVLLVPDRGRRAEVWRALSGPGSLVVDGEIAGTWRYRRREKELTITPFDGLAKEHRVLAHRSAVRLAAATGDDAPTVRWS